MNSVIENLRSELAAQKPRREEAWRLYLRGRRERWSLEKLDRLADDIVRLSETIRHLTAAVARQERHDREAVEVIARLRREHEENQRRATMIAH